MSLNKDRRLVEIAKLFSRNLRKNATEAEKIFWEAVRNKRFCNKKFYRQYPLFFDIEGLEKFFIADFFCHQAKLVVEIDGTYHIRQHDYDTLRTHVINFLGINVIRFKNEEVINNLQDVMKKLEKNLIAKI